MDTNIVDIPEEKQQQLLKEIKNLSYYLNFFKEMIETNTLNNDLKDTMLNLLDKNVFDYNKILNRTPKYLEENRKCSSRLVFLEQENKKIKKELKKVIPENIDSNYIITVINQITNALENKLKNKQDGIGGIVSMNIKSEKKVNIVFSPMFDFDDNSTPNLKEKENLRKKHKIWIANLMNCGFEFGKQDVYRLMLTDKNISLLKEKILEVLPNAKFVDMRTWCYTEKIIKSISLEISLEDLINDTK